MADKNQSPLHSHPWINFRLDLRGVPFKTWINLGECMSKCEHIAGTPLRPGVREELHYLYLAKGVQATTAIEGNTLTVEEVRQRIENKLTVPPSREYLAQEVDNIVTACNLIGRRVLDGEDPPLSRILMGEYNSIVLDKLPLPEHVTPGQLRKDVVGVGTYRAPSPETVPLLMDRLCEWLNGPDFQDPQLDPVILSIIKAVITHLYFVWIHPFGDGNGRTARLLEFDILLRSGFPSPAAHLLSNHYNATRSEYYQQLDAAGKKQDPSGFIAYAVEGFRDGLREQLKAITEQVRDVVWRSCVHERFRGLETRVATRQRHLVLDLSLHGEPVSASEIPTLTSRLRKEYARKTDRTLGRDLAALIKMDLLVSEKGKYRPNRSLIETVLPFRRKP